MFGIFPKSMPVQSHPPFVVAREKAGLCPCSARKSVYRRKLNRAWETLRSMPMPAIASDRLVDLHNDLTDYDTTVARSVRELLRGNSINRLEIRIDSELEEALRSFKAESPAEVECRRELLRYKRRIDDVVRELFRFAAEKPIAKDRMTTPVT
ncbi:MAG TPA: hypothetical protein PKE45_16115 [Caldilineaceae bacterium]|nr:hypothetical protein [Caldilineaceae bacterium]